MRNSIEQKQKEIWIGKCQVDLNVRRQPVEVWCCLRLSGTALGMEAEAVSVGVNLISTW